MDNQKIYELLSGYIRRTEAIDELVDSLKCQLVDLQADINNARTMAGFALQAADTEGTEK